MSHSPFQSPNPNINSYDNSFVIVNSEGEWIFKGTFNECEKFKNSALNSNKMSKSKVKKWIIVK